jgi:hypothetical protein
MPAAATARAQTYLVVVSGLGGTPSYQAEFESRGRALAAQARALGVDSSRVVHLGGGGVRATRESVTAAIRALAQRAESSATVMIVLLGHGSAGGVAAFNLSGPDITAEEIAALLRLFPSQRVAVVNTSGASGPWVAALSAPGRAIITATRSDREREQPVFGRYFVEAFSGDAADADKNGRVSLLEAFTHARRETDRFYTSAGRLRSEHAMLDDDGDREGALEPGASGDGALAATLYLAPAGRAVSDPAVAALVARQDSLERAIAGLRARRATMDSTAYQARLEALLLEAARVGRDLRARQAGQP